MESKIRYIPILKAKESELLALRNISPARQTQMIPLIEIQDIEKDEQLSRLNRRIMRSWNLTLPIFVDVDSNFLINSPLNATNALTNIISETREKGYHTIPVTGVNRGEDYQQAIRILIQELNEVCIRLKNLDIGNTTQMINNVTELVKSLGLKHENLDIVIDFGAFLPSQIGTFVNAATNTINGLPLLEGWRSITIAGTSFPDSLSSFRPVTPGLTLESDSRKTAPATLCVFRQ